MTRFSYRCLGLLLGLCVFYGGALWADEDGHNHGEAAPTATGPALPRLAMVSDDFELVAVLNGHRLQLFLDHAPDNRPVEGATLELQANGQNLPVTAVGAGAFEVDWDEAPSSGEVAFSAFVSAGSQSDLLVGDWDLHSEEEHAVAESTLWSAPWLPWSVAGLGLLMGGAGWVYGLGCAKRAARPAEVNL